MRAGRCTHLPPVSRRRAAVTTRHVTIPSHPITSHHITSHASLSPYRRGPRAPAQHQEWHRAPGEHGVCGQLLGATAGGCPLNALLQLIEGDAGAGGGRRRTLSCCCLLTAPPRRASPLFPPYHAAVVPRAPQDLLQGKAGGRRRIHASAARTRSAAAQRRLHDVWCMPRVDTAGPGHVLHATALLTPLTPSPPCRRAGPWTPACATCAASCAPSSSPTSRCSTWDTWIGVSLLGRRGQRGWHCPAERVRRPGEPPPPVLGGLFGWASLPACRLCVHHHTTTGTPLSLCRAHLATAPSLPAEQ